MKRFENILFYVSYICLLILMIALFVLWVIGMFNGASFSHQLLCLILFFVLDIDLTLKDKDI